MFILPIIRFITLANTEHNIIMLSSLIICLLMLCKKRCTHTLVFIMCYIYYFVVCVICGVKVRKDSRKWGVILEERWNRQMGLKYVSIQRVVYLRKSEFVWTGLDCRKSPFLRISTKENDLILILLRIHCKIQLL